jgi:hypothetical protein
MNKKNNTVASRDQQILIAMGLTTVVNSALVATHQEKFPV